LEDLQVRHESRQLGPDPALGTGLGFLTYYGVFDPAKLGNEKIWAKMIIVLILTVNGGFIHSIILPRVKKQIGRSIMEGLPSSHRSVFIVSGAISAVSWYVPMMLGALPQLNFAVPMGTILLAYATLLSLAILAAHALLFVMPTGHIGEASEEDVALSAEFA